MAKLDKQVEVGPKYNVFVVITLDEFLAQTEGGELRPVLSLVDTQNGDIKQQFDLEIRQAHSAVEDPYA